MQKQTLQALTDAILKQAFLPLEASGRHVHVTQAQALALFGHDLTPQRPLSQPGQFLAQERVTLIGPKGAFHNVAVLGPARKEAQAEISLTDGKALGVDPPIRLSGDIKDTPPFALVGECGRIDLPKGLIVAQRHIHLTPADGQKFHVTDGQVVRLETYTRRPCIWEDVVIRIHPAFAPAVHLDYDEANACGFRAGDWGRILP